MNTNENNEQTYEITEDGRYFVDLVKKYPDESTENIEHMICQAFGLNYNEFVEKMNEINEIHKKQNQQKEEKFIERNPHANKQKVIIQKARKDTFWYADRIGDVIEVYDVPNIDETIEKNRIMYSVVGDIGLLIDGEDIIPYVE